MFGFWDRLRYAFFERSGVRAEVTHDHGQYYVVLTGSDIDALRGSSRGYGAMANASENLGDLFIGIGKMIKTVERYNQRHERPSLTPKRSFKEQLRRRPFSNYMIDIYTQDRMKGLPRTTSVKAALYNGALMYLEAVLDGDSVVP
jgi:hypothetical protein